MELTTRVHRTWLCSVVFMDIVGYSKHPVSWQLDIKKRFNTSVSEAIERMPSDERLILDTGDGAALCFFGDPEQALYCAIRLRDRFSTGADWAENRVEVRFGINLGPVKLIRDVNAQLNAIGDGINDAQRVMAFAEPDQILISRSFYDVVERLSDDNHRLFQYLGMRDDKHRRSHAIYAVIPPADLSSDGTPSDAIFDVVSGTSNEEVIYRTINLGDGSVPPLDVTPVTAPIAAQAPLWDPAMLDAITKQLAQFAGPLARIMVSREAKHTADFDELYARLAGRLPAEKDRTRFLATKAAFVVVAHEPDIAPAERHTHGADVHQHDATSVPAPLTKETIEAARAKLVRYVGPIASVRVTRASRAASNEADFYMKLANFIESEADKTEFLLELGAAAQRVGLESL